MAETAICTIEHHAVLFALLAKHAVNFCGETGKKAILAGITRYGNERGQRMARNVLADGGDLTTLTSQAYGEWQPDYKGQMEFGQIRTQPTLQTYISKCAWCDAWLKHELLEYGKLYCVNIDHAVYQGFRSDFACTSLSKAMSWGGERCEFDWGHGLTDEENAKLKRIKTELGASRMKNFNFHTAHLLHTIRQTLTEECPTEAEEVVLLALREFASRFGSEYLKAIESQEREGEFI